MSTIGDALAALKSVVLMQERLDMLKHQVDRLSADVRGLNDYTVAIDKRLIRIETLIEMTARSGGAPRLEAKDEQ